LQIKSVLEKAKAEINRELSSIIKTGVDTTSVSFELKADGTQVSALDLFIHNYFAQHLKDLGNLISEEAEFVFKLPSFILDPIDGTREFISGIGECAVSLGYLSENKKESWGWIYNPINGFEILSNSANTYHSSRVNRPESKKIGFVSRSEIRDGLYDGLMDSKEIELISMGSIAYKLGLLASGACDFVVTERAKNIWDIAGGNILCEQRGIKLYSQDGSEVAVDRVKFDEPLIWCNPGDQDLLSSFLFGGSI
jgi:myo-inositol-1(or 4)-monophosphatase